MRVTIGSTVIYTLTEEDAEHINKRRLDFRKYYQTEDYRDTGYIAHVGNMVQEGESFPAIAIREWTENLASLQVLLDGNDTFWAPSRYYSDSGKPGCWSAI